MTTPPGPKGLPILGSLQAFNRERLGFLLEMAREYGDVVHYRLLNYAVYQLNHPDYVQAVLVEQAGAVEKNDLDKAIFNQSLGHGILSSEGEFHRAQRRLMQPAFHSKRIEAYGQVMTDYTERMLTRWAEGQTLDVHHAMTHLTMQIVSKTLYDADVGDEADGIGAAIDVLNRIGGEEFAALLPETDAKGAREVADRVVFMDAGEIVEMATPAVFFTNPQHERTKLFLNQIL